MKALIIITKSENDLDFYERLISNEEVSGFPLYICCDSHKVSNRYIEGSEHLLVVINAQQNTQNYSQTLKETLNKLNNAYEKTICKHSPDNMKIDNNIIDMLDEMIFNISTNDYEYEELLCNIWINTQNNHDVYTCEAEIIRKNARKYGLSDSFEACIDVVRSDSLVRNTSVAKHRIAHLFIPLITDIEGISNLSNNIEMKKYVSEIIDDLKDDGYSLIANLSKARHLIFGRACSGYGYEDIEKSLPLKQSIHESINNNKRIEIEVSEYLDRFIRPEISSCEKYVGLENFMAEIDWSIILENEVQLLRLLIGTETRKFDGSLTVEWFKGMQSSLDKIRKEIINQSAKK